METGCATGTKAGDKAAQRAAEDSRRNGFRTKAEMDDANSVAIAEAMQELMELDEERVIDISEQTPPSEGLTWSAEHGLQAAPPKVSPWPAPNPYGMNPRSGEPSPQAPIQQRSGPSSGSKKNPVPSSAASTSNSRGRPVSRVVLEAEAKKKQFQSLKSASTIKSEDLMTSSSQPSQSHSTRERWACLECTLVNEPNTASCDVCEAPRPGFSQAATRTTPMASSSGYQVSATSGPLGWLCSCGTFMEDQWWTCTRCSKMRPSS